GVLGGHEAPARNRPRPAAPAAHPVPRRVYQRARPPTPQPDLGIYPWAVPRRARDGVFHDTLHGGGRTRRRPDRGHRPRPDRGTWHRRGAATTDRAPHPGGRV